MEDIIKTITTKKGARVSLVQPKEGRPFFRYEAGAHAETDSFRYVIRQHGQEDTATVTVNVEVPVEEDTAQQDFNQQVNSFFKCMEKLMDGSAATMAMTNLLGIDEGDVLNDDWIDKIFTNFYYFDYATEEGRPFHFEEHMGRYIFNKEGYWDMASGGDSIQIFFPSSHLVDDNDTMLEIRDYKYQEVKTEDTLLHLPTNLTVSLRIKDQPYFNFSLGGAKSEVETQYHEETGFPIAFDTMLQVAPYQLQVVLDNKESKSFKGRIVLSDGDGCKSGLEAAVHFQDGVHSNLSAEEIHVEYATLHLNGLTFRGLETFWNAVQSKIETQEDIDSMVKITCHQGSELLGHIRFNMEQEAMYIEYEDGTSQNLNDLVMKFLDKYFNNDKPDGTPRNKAFDMSNDYSYRSEAKSAAHVGDSASKAKTRLSEGLRRRLSRQGVSTEKVADVIANFFVQMRRSSDEKYHDPYNDEMRRYEEEMRRHEEEMKKRMDEEEKARREQEEAAKKAEEAKREAEKAAEQKKREAEKEAEKKKREAEKKAEEAKAKKAAADANKLADGKAAAEAKKIADAKAKAEAERAKKAAEDKKKADAAKAKKAADDRAKAEAARAKKEADDRAKAEAKAVADAKKAADAARAKAAADARAKKAADDKAKAEAEAKAKAADKKLGDQKAGSGKRRSSGPGGSIGGK